ncbi:hypothetical protein IQ255_09430 [Pleurocapsales cyanobacterium LEGE 10410]|nr:hypothetical protein [Pleurocapsales cyanobacterium LEGE 10410]
MIKNLLRLLATSTSFVALLLIANLAVVITPVNNLAQAEPSFSSLNLLSPSLQLISSDRHTLTNHLGCSCATCTQSVAQISRNI